MAKLDGEWMARQKNTIRKHLAYMHRINASHGVDVHEIHVDLVDHSMLSYFGASAWLWAEALHEQADAQCSYKLDSIERIEIDGNVIYELK
jgi:hypothetical protein